MPCGNNQQIRLTFERATDYAALRFFKCGQPVVDHIIEDDLYATITTNDLFYVKDRDEVVAIFCLSKENHSLFLSDAAKGEMQSGSKPKPERARFTGGDYWEQFFYDSIELTLLAVKEDRRNQHIGSFIVESLVDYLAHDPNEKRDFLFVRALNTEDYSAIPFYRKCGFYNAVKEMPGVNLMMYRIIPK